MSTTATPSEARPATADPATSTPAQARARFRAGWAGPTSGWCTGYAQTNLVAVPRDWAYDFLLFTQRNPQPCPVLDVGDVGDPTTVLAPGADVRTDLPGYRVWRDGRLVDEPDVGDAVEFADGDVPVFWACGVTPQAAVTASEVPFALTHAPGHMFVTDVPDRDLRL